MDNRERSRIDGRNSPSRSSCIIDGRTRGWRRVVPFLCLQIAKLRPVLRSIVGSVAMNETGAPRISNDFGPGRSTTGSRAWQTIRGSICSRTCLQATRRRPARYGSRKKLPSDSTTRNPLPVSRPLLSLIPSTRLSILSSPSPLAQIHPGLFITQ